MPRNRMIAAVLLAGGRSSRMGQNKAFLSLNGQPLIDHMLERLRRTDVGSVIISGDLEGYESIPDKEPFNGPAQAIVNLVNHHPGYEGFLFVPVDMPLIEPGILHHLMSHSRGAYFQASPLPAFIPSSLFELVENPRSVQEMLNMMSIKPVELPDGFEIAMTNTNTPEEWKQALQL